VRQNVACDINRSEIRTLQLGFGSAVARNVISGVSSDVAMALPNSSSLTAVVHVSPLFVACDVSSQM